MSAVTTPTLDKSIFQLPQGRRPEGANAFAQITAKCMEHNQHVFSMFLRIRDDTVNDIRFAKGSAKFSQSSSGNHVENAVELFCAFANKKNINEVSGVTFSRLCDYFKCIGNSYPETDALTSDLYGGGAIPFMLFRWALVNYSLKISISRILGIAPDDQVVFDDAAQVYEILREIEAAPPFGQDRRAMELAIRALHMKTVDESTLRTLYQRALQPGLLKEAGIRGFNSNFR